MVAVLLTLALVLVQVLLTVLLKDDYRRCRCRCWWWLLHPREVGEVVEGKGEPVGLAGWGNLGPQPITLRDQPLIRMLYVRVSNGLVGSYSSGRARGRVPRSAVPRSAVLRAPVAAGW